MALAGAVFSGARADELGPLLCPCGATTRKDPDSAEASACGWVLVIARSSGHQRRPIVTQGDGRTQVRGANTIRVKDLGLLRPYAGITHEYENRADTSVVTWCSDGSCIAIGGESD
jgi:hypothetical protein